MHVCMHGCVHNVGLCVCSVDMYVYKNVYSICMCVCLCVYMCSVHICTCVCVVCVFQSVMACMWVLDNIGELVFFYIVWDMVFCSLVLHQESCPGNFWGFPILCPFLSIALRL